MKRRFSTFPSVAASAAIVLCAMTLGPPAQAAGWIAALKNTPAESFDDEDLQMFLAAGVKALNAEGTPEVVNWSNPATGAAGRFKELRRTETKDGRTCKRLQIWVSMKKWGEKSSVWMACKSEQGRWGLAAAK